MKTTRLSLYRNENGKVDLQSCYEEKETKNDDLSYPYYGKIDCIHSKIREKYYRNDRVNTFIIRLCDNAYVIRVLRSTMHDRYNIYVYKHIYIYINTPTYVQYRTVVSRYIYFNMHIEGKLFDLFKTESKQRHPVVNKKKKKKDIFINHETLYK